MSKTSRTERSLNKINLITLDENAILLHSNSIKSHRPRISDKPEIIIDTSFLKREENFLHEEPLISAIHTGRGSIKFSMKPHRRSNSINLQKRGRRLKQIDFDKTSLINQDSVLAAKRNEQKSFGSEISQNLLLPEQSIDEVENASSLSLSITQRIKSNATSSQSNLPVDSKSKVNKSSIFSKTMIKKRNRSTSLEKSNMNDLKSDFHKQSKEYSSSLMQKKNILPNLQLETSRACENKDFPESTSSAQKHLSVNNMLNQFKKTESTSSSILLSLKGNRNKRQSKSKMFEKMLLPTVASISELNKFTLGTCPQTARTSDSFLESQLTSPCVTGREAVIPNNTLKRIPRPKSRLKIQSTCCKNHKASLLRSPERKYNITPRSGIDQGSGFRNLLVLDTDFRKYYKCLIIKATIPNYETIYSKDQLERDFKRFLDEINQQFLNKKCFKQIFLVNGEPITNLSEIPLSCGLVLANNSMRGCNFRTRYFEYHNMESLSNDKWNLLLYLLNLQKEDFKVRYIITNEEFNKTIICNPSLQFHDLLQRKNMINMNKAVVTPLNKHETQTKKILDTLDYIYTKNDLNLPVNITEESMKKFNKSLHKINHNYRVQTDPVQYKRAQIIADLLEGMDIFVKDRDRRNRYIDTLDHLIPKTKTHEVQKGKSERPHIISKNEDYIQQNIQKVKTEYQRLQEIIEKENPPLYHLNIPKLQSESDFTRRELHKLYSKYKALCALFAIDQKEKRLYDPKFGFDKETFKKGFSQFKLASDNVLQKVLFGNETLKTEQKISWAKFLRIMMSLRAKSVKDKIAFFLRLLSSNGSEALSYTEIESLCTSALKPFQNGENDEVIVSLVDYFTRSVFQTCDMDTNNHIPIEKLIQIVEHKMGAVDLLLELAGAERTQAEEIALLDDGLIDKKIPHMKI